MPPDGPPPMKSAANAEALIALLDRHLERLVVATAPSDWTVYTAIQPFLDLLHEEPALADLIERYMTQASKACTAYTEALGSIRADLNSLFLASAPAITRLDPHLPDSDRAPRSSRFIADGFQLAEYFPQDGRHLGRLIDAVSRKVALAHDPATGTWREPSLEGVSERLLALSVRLLRAQSAFDVFRDSHPGHAITEIFGADQDLRVRSTADVAGDRYHDHRVVELRRKIAECQAWTLLPDLPAEPSILAIQRAVRTLHLALVTDLTRGYTRDQLLDRLFRRFEVFDRVAFLADRESGKAGDPDAWLTRYVARYLFDVGWSPLIDPDVAGVADDFIALLKEPATYVHAHYLPVVEGDMRVAFRAQVARMLASWERLSETWKAPEALLVFVRGSGKILPLQDRVTSYRGRNVRALTLNVAPVTDGMGRASPQFDLADVLPGATVTELSSRRGRKSRKDLS